MIKKIISVVFGILLIVLVVGLLFSNDDQQAEKNTDTLEVKGIVLETDDSNVVQSGISKIGHQVLKVKIQEGKYKGEIVKASNYLLGALEIDNFYKPNDKMIVALLEQDDKIVDAKAVELYRQDWILILFGVFVLCLILYARFIGLKALFSFVASLFVIWEVLITGLLEGKNPLILAVYVITLLTAIIVFSVAGFTRKGLAAFLGTICGLFITTGITLLFGAKLGLYGMTAPFAQTLVFSGHLTLNMQQIFYVAIIIGAAGAAMDIAMDVAASMEEVKSKKPDIGMKELIQSGFNVGKAVIGTMTTTLLLAYSGGYLTLLMLFMTKNSSFVRIINLKIVAAEIMRTVVGSIGLVLTAPITAVLAGWIFSLKISGSKWWEVKKLTSE